MPYLPRFRALALFGRRPSVPGDSFVIPASENLHNRRRPEGKKSTVNYRMRAGGKSSTVHRVLAVFSKDNCTVPWRIFAIFLKPDAAAQSP